MNLPKMKQVINGKLYNTETATEIASDCYWDGHNFERDGRNIYLMKTKKENYFAVHLTRWEGENDFVEALSKEQAKARYEQLLEHPVEYEEAFGEKPEEA